MGFPNFMPVRILLRARELRFETSRECVIGGIEEELNPEFPLIV